MDYGEPFVATEHAIYDRNGDLGVPKMKRCVSCTNSLSGIPDSWLEDGAAAMAIMAWKLWDVYGYCYTPEYSHETVQGISSGTFDEEIPYVVSQDQIIKAALRLRSRGADFGELNELIDSFKDA